VELTTTRKCLAQVGRDASDPDVLQRFAWLEQYRERVGRIVNFGCWASWSEGFGLYGGIEPYILLWLLHPEEVVVVDINPDHIMALEQYRDHLRRQNPVCGVQGLDRIKGIVGDMTYPLPELGESTFDMAFCGRVLLGMRDSPQMRGVYQAVTEMARVVKVGGLVVSEEADAGEPYPAKYVEIFEQTGFAEVRRVRAPLYPGVLGTSKIEYAIFERREIGMKTL
jgi:hypothetical protein